jgi:protein involved in polysaccharide export with SLBB domain
MHQKHLFRLFSFFIVVFGMSGCASYSDLPAGTHQKIDSKPQPAVVREVIDLSPNTAPAATGMVKTNDYIVGPNDILYVAVNGRLDFGVSGGAMLPLNTTMSNTFKGYRVDGKGFVYLPLAGKVPVGGLPLSDARDKIDAAIRNYFNNPWVIVEIAEYRTRQVFIFGAVKKPGPVTMPASGINLAQLISSADIQNKAQCNYRQIRIIRSNTPTQGELLIVDFDKVLRGQAVPMQMQEGDIVYVPKRGIGTWNEVITELLPTLQVISATLQPFVNIKYLQQ